MAEEVDIIVILFRDIRGKEGNYVNFGGGKKIYWSVCGRATRRKVTEIMSCGRSSHYCYCISGQTRERERINVNYSGGKKSTLLLLTVKRRKLRKLRTRQKKKNGLRVRTDIRSP